MECLFFIKESLVIAGIKSELLILQEEGTWGAYMYMLRKSELRKS